MLALIALLPLAAATGSIAAATTGCEEARGGPDIVICGERGRVSPYRLPRLPDKYDRKAIRAETDVVPGVHARARIDTSIRPDGLQDQRLMLIMSTHF